MEDARQTDRWQYDRLHVALLEKIGGWPPAIDELNRLGAEGWEIAGIAFQPTVGGVAQKPYADIVLKRRL